MSASLIFLLTKTLKPYIFIFQASETVESACVLSLPTNTLKTKAFAAFQA